MRRREFIVLLGGGVAASSPFTVRGQQSSLPAGKVKQVRGGGNLVMSAFGGKADIV
jgi:hypothetical protein